MDLRLQFPVSFGPLIPSAILPYGSFIVFLRITDPDASPPFMVDVSETPNPPVGVPGLTLSGGTVLQLSRETDIYNPFSLSKYRVSNISTFEMRWPYISFRVDMNTNDSAINDFKGGVMTVSVSNSSGYSDTDQVEILNTNPNNHFHWRRQPSFVDGWYFKCVHLDDTAMTATPFFFLYGINDPGGGANAESFVICSNAGTVPLSTGLAPTSGAVPTPFDLEDIRFPHAAFHGETFFGLDSTITTDFHATDRGCRGNKTLPSGDTISWDLTFTKIHTHCITDWNPLAPFEWSMELLDIDAFLEYPSMPLMHHFNRFSMMTAYYMSHNMNSFVSGTIDWKGQIYVFDNVKGYQDENWGSGGFPHPYVWMQANNFVSSGGTPLHDTSLVALFTPGMPMSGFAGSNKIGGICLRHDGNVYKFFSMDMTILGEGIAREIANFVYDIGVVTCEVDFLQGGVRTTVDMANTTALYAAIGAFPRAVPAIPVKWNLTGENSDGDVISIIAECDAATVIKLAAPLGGSMQSDVTKESLHARFVVTITPDGGTEQRLISEFGTAEYGD